MKEIWEIAWERFSLNSGVVADFNGRVIATLFYFTVLAPFGLMSAIFMDPLRVRDRQARWHPREEVPTDIESAKKQG